MVEKEKQGFFTEQFNKKLPFLLVSLVFFLLSLYTFFNTGITFGFLFDLGKLASDPTAFYSTQLLLFGVVFSLAISLTAFFGAGLNLQQAAIPLVLFTLVSLATLAFLPSYTPLFFAFALGIGSGAIFASTAKEFNFDSMSIATRRALTVFLILVILFSIIKIELNKESYLDKFITGAASLSPQLAEQVLPLCGQPFSKLNAQDVVPRAATDALAQNSYDQYRSSILRVSNSSCNLQSDIPTFSQLGESDKTNLKEQTRTTAIAGVSQILKGLTEQLQSEELKEQLSQYKVSKKDLAELREQLRQVEYFQLVENYFSLFIAFILFSIVSGFTFVVKLLNYPVNFLLLQISKLQIETKE